ncbi:hypothetical protein LCGC14_0388370 [marine sediment metagenome]|uniref:Uncharacterized protein n=1 Tax=marine sediment metagenome TaxID=412755 RepID=A0A0F9T099_9ZZZZ
MKDYDIFEFGVDKNFKEFRKKVGTYEAFSEDDAIHQHAEATYPEDDRGFMSSYLTAKEVLAPSK